MQACGDTAESELAASLAVECNVGGSHHVEEVLVPQLHFDDPPFAFQKCCHCPDALGSLGIRPQIVGQDCKGEDGLLALGLVQAFLSLGDWQHFRAFGWFRCGSAVRAYHGGNASEILNVRVSNSTCHEGNRT